MKTDSNLAIIITAAGSSTRMGGSTKKEYLPFNNGTVLSGCAKTFLKTLGSFPVTAFVITCPVNGTQETEKILFSDKEFCELYKPFQFRFKFYFVEGGNSRQKSVFNALHFLKCHAPQTEYVLIHDGARPFVNEKTITDVLDAAVLYGASVPGIIPTDTQKEVDSSGFIKRHLVRSNLRAVQTPQAFRFPEIYSAHEKAAEEQYEFTDDTEIWGKYAGNVKVVEGSPDNIKITYPGDLQKL